METIKTKLSTAFDALQARLGYTNQMQSPRIEKIVVASGTGKIEDKAKLAIIEDRLARITGQKASPRPAKKSIASFKLREGDIVGYQVTLRGSRMQHFLDKLIHVALPQTRDFRGLKRGAIDEMGNFTIGIKDNTIFPECRDEEINNVFGLAITIVTTANSREEAEAFLEHLGLPLKKIEGETEE